MLTRKLIDFFLLFFYTKPSNQAAALFIEKMWELVGATLVHLNQLLDIIELKCKKMLKKYGFTVCSTSV